MPKRAVRKFNKERIYTRSGFRTMTALELVDVLISELGSVRYELYKAKEWDAKGDTTEVDIRINGALAKIAEMHASWNTLEEWWKDEYELRQSARKLAEGINEDRAFLEAIQPKTASQKRGKSDY